jgi:hypothetical protein
MADSTKSTEGNKENSNAYSDKQQQMTNGASITNKKVMD